MISLRYLKRDLRLGLLNRFCFLVFPVILSVAQALEFHRAVIGLLSFESNWGVGTIMDYYMYSVRGMRIFFFDPREYFQIPIYWFAFQIGAVYFTAYYGYNDYVNQGKMLFVLPKSRSGWWIGKWSWCCICTTPVPFHKHPCLSYRNPEKVGPPFQTPYTVLPKNVLQCFP